MNNDDAREVTAFFLGTTFANYRVRAEKPFPLQH